MASSRLHNALLFVIAVCLVLLVVHFYSGHLVDKAQAAQPTPPAAKSPAADPKAQTPETPSPMAQPPSSNWVYLFGCDASGGTCHWSPVKVDPNGYLLTKPAH
jgi:hypothetical protein